MLDTAERAGAALAGREVKKLPTLRGRTVVNLFFEDSTRTRTSFEAGGQAAVRRRHQLLGQGLERVQGREPQGHRADPGGDGRGRGGDPALRLRRAAPAGRAGCAAAWSTPATAPTSTRPRRCSTRSRCAAGSAGSTGLRVAIVGDVLHSRVARSNVLLLHTLGAEVTLVAPPTLLPVGVEAWPCRGLLRPRRRRCPRRDVVMMLRVQRERMDAAFFPIAREYSPPLRAGRAPDGAAAGRTRSSCTPAR